MTRLLHSTYTWSDGKFLKSENVRIPLLTHSLHYGSAVFEGERFYMTDRGPAIFRLTDHTNRLFNSAKVMGMKIPFSRKDIVEATKKLILKNKLKEGYIRPILFYGEKMGLSPRGCAVHAAISVWPWGSYFGELTIKLKTSAIRRLDARTVVPAAKVSGYYANSILATLEAVRAGFDEAILLDTAEFVAEGPGENIFLVKRGVLMTPALGSILPGITRNTVIAIARDKQIRVIEKRVTPQELKNADEIFFTGTAAEVAPVGRIDNKKINNSAIGPLTALLKNYYLSVVHGRVPQYYRWLTVVR